MLGNTIKYLTFLQLLAVLPAASKHLLPTPFHDLMTDEDSAIVHYYPVSFETDLNGKINDWEAVVLIPFIDEVCGNKARAVRSSPFLMRIAFSDKTTRRHVLF